MQQYCWRASLKTLRTQQWLHNFKDQKSLIFEVSIRLSVLLFFFPWSGWHIKKVQLIQRFKMCLLWRLFPNSAAFPLAEYLLPPSPLFIYLMWERTRKQRQQTEGGGFAWKIPRKEETHTGQRVDVSLTSNPLPFTGISIYCDGFLSVHSLKWWHKAYNQNVDKICSHK